MKTARLLPNQVDGLPNPVTASQAFLRILSALTTMGKNNKGKSSDEVPNPNSISNRDIIQRLSFLYQASVYLNGISPSQSPEASSSKAGGDPVHEGTKIARKRRRRPVVTTSDLSRSYVKTMKIVGQKTTVKMCVPVLASAYPLEANEVSDRDPSVKRTLCQGCNTILIPGSTASVRVKCMF